jgi:hypothetical protein
MPPLRWDLLRSVIQQGVHVGPEWFDNKGGEARKSLNRRTCVILPEFEDRRGGNPPRGVRLAPLRLCRRTAEVKACRLVSGRPVSGRRRPVGHPKAPPLRDSP